MIQRGESELFATEPTDDMEPSARYSDSELVNLVEREVHASQNDWQSKVAQTREWAQKYYYGELPYAVENNTSDYVSREVFDSVESIKAKLMHTFTGNRKVIRFKPVSEQDVEAAEVRTDYVQRIFFKENNGYKILNDVFHDGLLSKQGCIKRTWREKTVTVSESFENIPMQQLEAAAMDPSIERVDVDSEQTINNIVQTALGPITQPAHVVSGSVFRKEDRSGVEVEVIPPEDVFISATCTDINNADFVAVRYEKSRFELIQEGFDPDVVNKIAHGDRIHFDTEEQARHTIDDTFDFHQREGDDERSLAVVYEAYVWIDMLTPKDEQHAQDAQLWHIVVGGTQLLFKEVVDEIPMLFWSPIMISHKGIGMGIADVTMDLQNGTSNTVRGMIDNVHRVNAGVRTADLSLLDNPRQFIDNAIGGVVDASAAAQKTMSVVPQPAISPITGNLLQIFSQEKEQRTGDTALGKGLQTQDVITHQNSGDMIDTLINAGNERPLMMARSFAEVFKQLMLDIYRLGYENGQKVPLSVGGRFQDVDIRQVPYGEEMEIDVALTPDYGESRAAQLMQLHGAVSADQELQKLYSLEERYATMSEVYDLMGFANYLGDPKDPKVQQRMQQGAQQAKQIRDMQIQMEQMGVKLQQQALALQDRKIKGDHALAKEKLDLDSAVKSDAQRLSEQEFGEDRRMNRWDQRMDLAEYQLEKTQERPVSVN